MSAVGPSGNQDIDGILWGYKWDATNLTYSMPTITAEYGYTQINGFEAMNAAQITAIHRIMANYDSVCSLSFTYTTAAGAYIRFAEASSIDRGSLDTLHTIGTAEGTPPDPDNFNSSSWGDTWYNHTSYNNPSVGSFAYAAGFMHEVGHALGLKHGHSSQYGHGVLFPILPSDHDSYEYSVMTYRQYVGDNPTSADNAPHHPTSLMMNDIAALQYMYGADYGTNSGNTTYTFNTTTGEMSINGVGRGTPIANYVLLTVWDGGGIDTFDLSNYTSKLTLNLNPGQWLNFGTQLANLGDGHFARGNVANALLYNGNSASLIENAIGGSGNDLIIGNDANNLLQGMNGNDTIFGGLGNDTVFGDLGDDAIIGEAGSDQLLGGSGNDYIWGHDENDLLKGEDGNDTLNSGNGADNIYGGNGNDVLIGFAGADSLYGEAGTDTCYGGNEDDGIFGLGENDTLHGELGNDQIWGGLGDDVLTGSDGGDTLQGENGSDFMWGGNHGDFLLGFAGNDTMQGEHGDDRFSGGLDHDFMSGGDGADQLEGDQGNDTIYGGNHNDILTGGTGNDTMSGEHGADTFFFTSDFGNDIIVDFTPGATVDDILVFAGVGMPILFQDGANLHLNFGVHGEVNLANVHFSQLHPNDIFYI